MRKCKGSDLLESAEGAYDSSTDRGVTGETTKLLLDPYKTPSDVSVDPRHIGYSPGPLCLPAVVIGSIRHEPR